VIEYVLPVAGDVYIELYNVTGQKVKTLIQGRQDAGIHRFTFDASGLSNGIYFLYRDGQVTQKIIKVIR